MRDAGSAKATFVASLDEAKADVDTKILEVPRKPFTIRDATQSRTDIMRKCAASRK